MDSGALTVGQVGGVVTLIGSIIVGGMFIGNLSSRADSNEKRLLTVDEFHKEVQSYIQLQKEKEARSDENLRALCAAKKLTAGAAYCETRGFMWGTTRSQDGD